MKPKWTGNFWERTVHLKSGAVVIRAPSTLPRANGAVAVPIRNQRPAVRNLAVLLHGATTRC